MVNMIILIDDANNIFARCPVRGNTGVERTLDSGNYFMLRFLNVVTG